MILEHGTYIWHTVESSWMILFMKLYCKISGSTKQLFPSKIRKTKTQMQCTARAHIVFVFQSFLKKIRTILNTTSTSR